MGRNIVVRRIDGAGRVVIPKTLCTVLGLKKGDPVKMVLDGTEALILSKFSMVNELCSAAEKYADALHYATGHIAMIADTKNVIAVSGVQKKEMYINMPVWSLAKKAMQKKAVLMDTRQNTAENFWYKTQVVAPVIFNEQPMGVVGLISVSTDVGDIERKLVETIALAMGYQLEGQ